MSKRWVESLEARRLLAALTPDLTFGEDGFVGSTGGSVIYTIVGLQPDGRPIVQRTDNGGARVQQYSYLQRLSTGGVVDRSYSGGAGVRQTDGGRGHVVLDHLGRAIWAQRYDPDGVPYNNVFSSTIHRLDANGNPDPAFGKNGRMPIAFPVAPVAGQRVRAVIVEDVAVDSLGRAHLLLNVWCARPADADNRLASVTVVVRTSETGRFDPTFGEGGFAYVKPKVGPVDHWRDTAPRITIDRDGRILVAGQLGEDTLMAARFTSAGEADPDFGIGGSLTTPAGSEPYISNSRDNDNDPVRYRFDPAGGIVYADYEPNYVTGGTPHVFRRITPDGTLDTSFGDGGAIDFDDNYAMIAGFDADGNILFRLDQSIVTYTLAGDLVESNPVPPGVDYYPRENPIIDSQGRQYVNSGYHIVRLVEPVAAEYDAITRSIRIASLNAGEDFVISRNGRRVVIQRDGEVILRVTERVSRIVVLMNILDDTLYSTANLPLDVRENERPVSFQFTAEAGPDGDVVSVDASGVNLGNGGSDVRGSVVSAQTIRGGAGQHSIMVSSPYQMSYLNPDIRNQPRLTLRLTGGSYNVHTSRLNTDAIFNTTIGVHFTSNHGNDRVSGGSGDDYLNMGNGTDFIYGNEGNDVIVTRTTTHSYIAGGPGNDFIDSRQKSFATLDGGSGDDTIRSSAGTSLLLGGKGRDTFHASNEQYDMIDGGDGNDIAYVDDDDVLTSIERVRS